MASPFQSSPFQSWHLLFNHGITFSVMTSPFQSWHHLFSHDITFSVMTSPFQSWHHLFSHDITFSVMTSPFQSWHHLFSHDITFSVMTSPFQSWHHLLNLGIAFSISIMAPSSKWCGTVWFGLDNEIDLRVNVNQICCPCKMKTCSLTVLEWECIDILNQWHCTSYAFMFDFSSSSYFYYYYYYYRVPTLLENLESQEMSGNFRSVWKVREFHCWSGKKLLCPTFCWIRQRTWRTYSKWCSLTVKLPRK